MRTPADVPRRPRRRRMPARLLIAGAVIAIIAAVASARGVAGIYTDFLWFDSLGFSSVWRGLLWARIGLFVLFAAVFFVLLFANLLVAERLSPAPLLGLPADPRLARLSGTLERSPRLLRALVAALLAVVFGGMAVDRWHDWVMFRNYVPFGVDDPLFGRDAGFYVFQLPFLTFAVDWLFAALLVTLLFVAGAHYLGGGIRWRNPRPRVASGARAQLSVLLAALALVRAAAYYLDRFELTFSTRGVVDGAGFTDVNAQLPAMSLLIAISLLAAALFVASIWRRGWIVPAIAVGLWALVGLVAGVLYPAFIQRFRVEPAESTREVPFIERNIEATRAAMGLSEIEVDPFAYDEELGSQELADNAETIRNVRLWDPQVLQQTYQRLQEVRTFYRFTDVDVDRYELGDELTQTMLSARELNPEALPSDTWENRHLAFTHGFGAVISPANAVTADGQPDFLVRNIPPQGEPEITEPRLYYGEGVGGFAIVGTGRDEIDYLRDDGTPVTNRYEGPGGVGVGTIPRRLAFALRFGDINPLISGFMTDESRILYMRDVRERAQAVAPFLHLDHDPYPIVLDGRISWVLDAYTTTSRYPYAQRADTNRLEGDSGLDHEFNYVRNSVKITVDAYDGTTRLYVVDPDDPIAAAYRKAFPDLFVDAEDAVPEALRAHFRYPEDLFRVQTNMWGRYHITDANEFYSQSDRWNIAQDPGSGGGPTVVTVPPAPGQPPPESGPANRMDPYYLLMRLPGATQPEFLILQPFVPYSEDDSRRELSAFMVAKSDPEGYGDLQVFVMPRDRQVDGPAIVSARINQEPEISQLITLLSRAGSEVLLGNLILVPVEQSLVYVQPLYVQATGANAVPELKNVIVVFGDRIAIRETFQEALTAVFGDAPETLEERPPEGEPPGEEPPGGTAPPAGPLPDEVNQLLDEAAVAFTAADQALRNGDP
ncbi:MAG: UPF0182 family protein, partial [Acidimicrobiia bacterium]|nr:UPF0182 family protein [Acidimicrobiia bacterium]